jgi:hypothetical protein
MIIIQLSWQRTSPGNDNVQIVQALPIDVSENSAKFLLGRNKGAQYPNFVTESELSRFNMQLDVETDEVILPSKPEPVVEVPKPAAKKKILSKAEADAMKPAAPKVEEPVATVDDVIEAIDSEENF